VTWRTLDATAEEQQILDTMHASMTQGWSGTMEQLAAYLATPKQIAKGKLMQIARKSVTPCLWFDTQAEEAAKFYCSVFKNSKITSTSRFPDAGQDVHHKPAGSVMAVAFELDGQPFTALNGGPQFKFDEAVSFQVMCDTQAEVDHYWNALTKEGQEGPCGWLKDKFGLSWQVVPSAIPKMMTDPDAKKSARVMNAFMKMKKLDLETLNRAYEGPEA
jgi:predicted 3-demethylubiquinone-9 3-methyltransferase (glyoxalase superfamily)